MNDIQVSMLEHCNDHRMSSVAICIALEHFNKWSCHFNKNWLSPQAVSTSTIIHIWCWNVAVIGHIIPSLAVTCDYVYYRQ